jgi:hypothetical protein
VSAINSSLQVWGTPEMVYEKVMDIQRRTGAEAYTGIFSYGGMPYDLAEASLRLFAGEVMPELKRRVPVEDQLIARAGVGQRAEASAFRILPTRLPPGNGAIVVDARMRIGPLIEGSGS